MTGPSKGRGLGGGPSSVTFSSDESLLRKSCQSWAPGLRRKVCDATTCPPSTAVTRPSASTPHLEFSAGETQLTPTLHGLPMRMFLSDARFIVSRRYEESSRRSAWASASRASEARHTAARSAAAGRRRKADGWYVRDMSAHRERARGGEDAGGADQLQLAGAGRTGGNGRLDLVLGLRDDRRRDAADADLGGDVEAAGGEQRDRGSDARDLRGKAVEAGARRVGPLRKTAEGPVVRVAADRVGEEPPGEIVVVPKLDRALGRAEVAVDCDLAAEAEGARAVHVHPDQPAALSGGGPEVRVVAD